MFKKLEKEKIIILVIAGILAILTIIKIIDKSYEKQENIQPIAEIIETENQQEEIAEETIIIYITGEVKNQGVIELKRRKQNSRCNRKSWWTNRKSKYKECKFSI